MPILAFELSSTQGSVALQVGELCEQVALGSARKQIEQVLPVVDALLQKHQLNLSNIDCLALSAGPGSFTGLRVALGICQGLALGSALPVVALSSLSILAQSAQRLLGAKQVVCCVNAFMEQVYLGQYALDMAGEMLATQNDSIQNPSDISLATELKAFAVGDGWSLYPELLAKNSGLQFQEGIYPQAQDMMPLAQMAFKAGLAKPIEQVNVNYLRDKSAWQKTS